MSAFAGVGILLATISACDGHLAADTTLPDVAAVDAASSDRGAADVGPPPPSMPAAAPLVQWVDPFVGTGGIAFQIAEINPGPQTPFGMVRPGPDTTSESGAVPAEHCSGYLSTDTIIQGFSLDRLEGAGITDYGAVGLMPTLGITAAQTTETGYRSHFDKATEQASPGYYAVTLADTDIRVEWTATDHVGVQRYGFPPASDAVVLVDLAHTIGSVTITAGHVDIDPVAREVYGYVHFVGDFSSRFGGMDLYFVQRFARPFARYGVWSGTALSAGVPSADGPDGGAYVGFDVSTDTTVVAAAGISFVDVAHARANLDAEAAGLDFDVARAATTALWEHTLAAVEIQGRSTALFRTFYSALYHSFAMPTLASDVDGSYRGLDGAVHMTAGFRYYTDFSLWDTFRTLHPMLTLLRPDFQTDMLRSLALMARDSGFLPRWPLGIGETGGMIGDSADIVAADAWVKGVQGFDLPTLYAAARQNAMGPLPAGAMGAARGGIADYIANGYVSLETGGASVSETLEYAYDDYAMAVLANAVGASGDVTMFQNRSHNWRNVLEPTTGVFLGRHADGSFSSTDLLTSWQSYFAEGDAWQYAWYVEHDVDGLAAAVGGRDAFVSRLETFFERSVPGASQQYLPAPYYWAGNEPDIEAPYMFAAVDDGAHSARWARWAATTFYRDAPDGLPGNDDSGTMSAWYVFSALGFYPIPATDQYLMGSPIVTRAVLNLPGGTFTIDAPDSSDQALYVATATLNGVALSRPRFSHASIASGGTLNLTMTTTSP